MTSPGGPACTQEGSSDPDPADRPAGTLTVERSAENVPAVRDWVCALLRGAVPAEVAEDALLVASELVANSVQHTRSDLITVTVALTADRLVITVQDRGPGLPVAWPVPGHRGRSRGLMMVSKLTTELSSAPGPDGSAVVRAVLAVAGRAGAGRSGEGWGADD